MKMTRLFFSMAFLAAFSFVFAQNSTQKPPIPFLGVECDEDAELEEGLLIEGVYRGFGAAEAGLQRGDILIAVNGDDVNSIRELNLELKNFKAGDAVELTFKRFNKDLKATAKLSEKPRYDDRLEVVRRAETDGKKANGKKAFMGIYPSTDWAAGGVRVTGFTQKSQAWRAGLEEDDVIVKLDEAQISTADQLNNYLFEKAPGQEMTVVFRRNGNEKNLKMTLGETDECCAGSGSSWGSGSSEKGWEGSWDDLEDRLEKLGEEMAERGEELGERLGRRGEELADEIEQRMTNRRPDGGRRERDWGGERFFSLRDFSAVLNSENGNLTVSFSGRSNQNFAVAVTDEDGRELAREQREWLDEGLFTHQFDLSKQPKGVYYVRVWKEENVVASTRVEKN